MTSVDSGTANAVCLTYDALGRIVEQAKGSGCTGSYTEIVYAPSGAKLALMNGQSLVKAFVSLPSGEAVYTSTGLAYYRHQDWLGSSRLATTPSRTMYYDTAYAPFGENYQGSGTMDLSFTGQNQDTIGGGVPGNLYDFLYREDNPAHGRWLSPDPAGLTAVDPTSPQTWNRYAYVGNDPLSAVDPFGLCQVSDRPSSLFSAPGSPRPNSCSPPIGPPEEGGGGHPSGQPGGSSGGAPHGAWPNGETLGLPKGLNASPFLGLDGLLGFVPGLFCGRTTGSGLTTTSTPTSHDILCPLLTVVAPVLAVFQASKNSTSDEKKPGLCKSHECPGRACYIDNCTSLNGPGGKAVQGFDCVADDKKGKDCCIDSYIAFASKCKARNVPGYPTKYKPNYDPGASGNISGQCCQLYQ